MYSRPTDQELLFTQITILSGLQLVGAEVIFTLYDDEVNWATAKSRCESLGQRLVVLDTAEKRNELKAQM